MREANGTALSCFGTFLWTSRMRIPFRSIMSHLLYLNRTKVSEGEADLREELTPHRHLYWKLFFVSLNVPSPGISPRLVLASLTPGCRKPFPLRCPVPQHRLLLLSCPAWAIHTRHRGWVKPSSLLGVPLHIHCFFQFLFPTCFCASNCLHFPQIYSRSLRV